MHWMFQSQFPSVQRHTHHAQDVCHRLLFLYLGLFISNHAQNTCVLLYEWRDCVCVDQVVSVCVSPRTSPSLLVAAAASLGLWIHFHVVVMWGVCVCVSEHLEGSAQGFSLFCCSKLWMMGMYSRPRLNISSVCLSRHAADAHGRIVYISRSLALSRGLKLMCGYVGTEHNLLFCLWHQSVFMACGVMILLLVWRVCVCVCCRSLRASAGSEEGERQASGRSAAGSAQDQEKPADWNHFHQHRVRCERTHTHERFRVTGGFSFQLDAHHIDLVWRDCHHPDPDGLLCVCVWPCVCVTVCMCLCVCMCVCVCLCVWLCVCDGLCVCVWLCDRVCVTVCVCVCDCVCVCVRPCVCETVCVWLYVFLTPCENVWPCVYNTYKQILTKLTLFLGGGGPHSVCNSVCYKTMLFFTTKTQFFEHELLQNGYKQ